MLPHAVVQFVVELGEIAQLGIQPVAFVGLYVAGLDLRDHLGAAPLLDFLNNSSKHFDHPRRTGSSYQVQEIA